MSESKAYLLDTSALFSLIEDEPGATRVEELLRTEHVLVPFVVGLEVYYITLQERSDNEADQRLTLIRQLPIQWLDQVTNSVLLRAGRFKAVHRVSFADALIAAFAAEARAILIHKDPEYEALSQSVEQEKLPSK